MLCKTKLDPVSKQENNKKSERSIVSPRFGLSVSGLPSQLVAIGGSNLNSIEALELESESNRKTLPVSEEKVKTSNLGVVATSNKIVVFGGV